MDFWGNGKVFVDPKVADLDPAAIRPYLTVARDDYTGHVDLAVAPPAGWYPFITQDCQGGDAQVCGPWYVATIQHIRPDGFVDVYGVDGKYKITSTMDSGDGLAGIIVRAVMAAGIGAAAAEVFAAAGAAGAPTSAPPSSTGAPTVDSFDYGGYAGDANPYGIQVPEDWATLPADAGIDAGTSLPDLFPDQFSVPTGPSYPIPEVTITPGSVPAGSSFSIKDALGAVKEITGTALSVMSTVRAFQGQVSDPTTANRSANSSNGMILTRNANGQITAARPAVGVATVAADGSMIINNGDGTYTVIGQDGSRVTRAYGNTTGSGVMGSSGAIDPKLLLIGGAALLGVMMMSRGGRAR